MRIRRSIALACVGVLAAACASMRGEQKSDNPTTNAAVTSQQQSEQALKRAQDSQKAASDQEKKASQAQADVQKAQQELTRAQQKAREEQAKAEQLQQQANQATQDATQQAQSSQQAASSALSQANRQSSRGHMAAHGTVTQASPDVLVLRPDSGDQPMTFRVTDQTQVRIDGRQANVTDIQQGQPALVSYEAGNMQPSALTVQVVTGDLGGSPQGMGSSGSTSPSSSGSTYGSPSSAGTGSSSTGTGASGRNPYSGDSGAYGQGSSTGTGATDTGASAPPSPTTPPSATPTTPGTR